MLMGYYDDRTEYIYSLSHEGSVFYIGKTAFPLVRYKQHCSCTQNTSDQIKKIIETGQFPLFRIICHAKGIEAQVKEREIIRLFCEAGQSLINIDWNYHVIKNNPVELPSIVRHRKTKNWAKQVAEYIELYNEKNKIKDNEEQNERLPEYIGTST